MRLIKIFAPELNDVPALISATARQVIPEASCKPDPRWADTGNTGPLVFHPLPRRREVQVLDDLLAIFFEPLPSANEQPNAETTGREAHEDRLPDSEPFQRYHRLAILLQPVGELRRHEIKQCPQQHDGEEKPSETSQDACS